MFVEKDDLEEKLAKSLTAENTSLLPFLPYLLQDLWGLGSNPLDMIKLMKNNVKDIEKMRVLDLACGKGEAAIKIAETLKAKVQGVDIIPEFIEFSEMKALERGVSDYCYFIVGDINKTVLEEKDYDCSILGAVGDVLGNPKETILKIKKTIKPCGYMIIDDAYLDCEATAQMNNPNYEYMTYDQWQEVFEETGMVVVDYIRNNSDNEQNDSNTQKIITRAMELIKLYPQHKKLFEDYIESQKSECEDLENNLIGVTWLLKMK